MCFIFWLYNRCALYKIAFFLFILYNLRNLIKMFITIKVFLKIPITQRQNVKPSKCWTINCNEMVKFYN